MYIESVHRVLWDISLPVMTVPDKRQVESEYLCRMLDQIYTDDTCARQLRNSRASVASRFTLYSPEVEGTPNYALMLFKNLMTASLNFLHQLWKHLSRVK